MLLQAGEGSEFVPASDAGGARKGCEVIYKLPELVYWLTDMRTGLCVNTSLMEAKPSGTLIAPRARNAALSPSANVNEEQADHEDSYQRSLPKSLPQSFSRARTFTTRRD